MSNYPEHIQKLITEAKTVPYQSAKYWELRCNYLEKYIDTKKQFEKTFQEPLDNILQAIGWSISDKVTLESFFV